MQILLFHAQHDVCKQPAVWMPAVVGTKHNFSKCEVYNSNDAISQMFMQFDTHLE